MSKLDGWWNRLWEYLTARPAGTVGAGAGVAAAVAATVIFLPTTPAPPPDNPGAQQAAPPPITTTTPAPAPPAKNTPSMVLVASQIYLAPGASDANGDGSQARPFASLAKAASTVQPGQTIVARGGVYQPTQAVEIRTDGTASKRITLTNAPGERPVFDAARIPADEWFITQTAGFWTVRGIEIRNAPRHSYVCVSCRSDVFSSLSIHDGHGIGLLLRGEGTDNNQVLDGDFYRNHDPGASADGLAFKYGSGAGNIVRGCRFWGNVDDGLDLHEFAGPVTVDRQPWRAAAFQQHRVPQR